MKVIFRTAIAFAVGLAVLPTGAGDRLSGGAIRAVGIDRMADETGYTAGRRAARDVNPRNPPLYHDRYEDDLTEGHRNAAR